MKQIDKKQFDFDDWAGLYLENPEEFEARRQAALMIELAKGSEENAAAGRLLLESFENAAHDKSAADRMIIASNMMMESAHQLSAELQLLKLALEKAHPTSPDSPSDSSVVQMDVWRAEHPGTV